MTAPTAPSALCWGSVRGKVARFTLLDSCGRPVIGPKSTLTTTGFVTVTLSPQYEEGSEITVTKADGSVCINDKADDTLTRFDTTITLCSVNPALVSMLAGYEVVLDQAATAVGFRVSETIAKTGVAIELWSDVSSEDDAACAAGAGGQWGYFLAPRIVSARLSGDVVIQNDAVSIELSARTKRNSLWGTGPYPVVASGTGGAAGKLLTPIGGKDHLHAQLTTIAPPEETGDCGPVPLAA